MENIFDLKSGLPVNAENAGKSPLRFWDRALARGQQQGQASAECSESQQPTSSNPSTTSASASDGQSGTEYQEPVQRALSDDELGKLLAELREKKLEKMSAQVTSRFAEQKKVHGIWNSLRDWYNRKAEQRLLAKLVRVAQEVRTQYFAAIVDIDVMYNAVSVDVWIRPDIKPDVRFNVLFEITYENTFKKADLDIKPRIRETIKNVRALAKLAPTVIYNH